MLKLLQPSWSTREAESGEKDTLVSGANSLGQP